MSKGSRFNLLLKYQPFVPKPCFAVGVSGGADSLALVFMARDWAEEFGGRVVALIVDHGLRVESGAEAVRTANLLSENNIEAHILRWEGVKPTHKLQEAAREARYRLFDEWCIAKRVFYLLLAHHQEDQAETFMLRLGSGVDGLSCMQEVTYRPFGLIIRPLLEQRPELMREYLRKGGIVWIEDPSNQNPRFERVRWRGFLKDNAGLSLEITKSAEKLQRVRATLEKETANLLAGTLTISPLGFARLDALDLWSQAWEEIRRRALARIIGVLRRRSYSPSDYQLEKASLSLPEKSFSLGGFSFISKREHVLIVRENRDISQISITSARTIWDKRWEIITTNSVPDIYIAPLNNHPNSLPLVIRQTLPGIYDAQGLLAAPAIGFCREPHAQRFQTKFLPGIALDNGFCLFPRYKRLSI